MSEKIISDIKEITESKCVVMYSKGSCPYCTMTRKIFQKLKVDFLEIDLNKESNGSDVQDALEEITGAHTVPRVFIGGKCIGGGSETKALNDSGELLLMIKACQQ